MSVVIVLVGLLAGAYPALLLSGFLPARILKAPIVRLAQILTTQHRLIGYRHARPIGEVREMTRQDLIL